MPATRSGPGTVVGIGASAGGVRALQRLLADVPAADGISYVVVTHLDPDGDSRLAEVLGHSSAVPVVEVQEPTALAGGHVYVLPPGWNLEADGHDVRLAPLADGGPRAPIDHFFRTLGSVHDRDAIAVVLTGAGSDGSLGLDAVRAAGGLTIVQDPADAEFDGMPRSAVATGSADLVLPLDQIAGAIAAHHGTRPRLVVPETDEEADAELLASVVADLRARVGHDFEHYKPTTVLRRIRRRMHLHRIEEPGEYLALLHRSDEELAALFDDLLISVTRFFRDEDVFEHLGEHVLPGLVASRDPGESVRIWSVGCSTGEEAYTLAILAQEALERTGSSAVPQIFASDLSARALQRAREGAYPESIADDVTPERLRRWFARDETTYRVIKPLRDTVVFAPHNVLRDPPFSRLDLIVCRNMLIYLRQDVQERVIDLFHYSLGRSGHLLLGPSETVDRHDLFEVVDKKRRVYRRRDGAPREPRLPVFAVAAGAPARAPTPIERSGGPRSYGELHEQVVERYAPPSVLVGPGNEALHLSATAGRFLVHPGGEPTSDVVRLVRPELRGALRAGLYAARDTGRPTRSNPVPTVVDGEPADVVVRVHPTGDEDGLSGLTLVIFDVDAGGPGGRPRADPATTDAIVRDLEAELDFTRQRLQAVIEDYETSQEEMRAANEEMQSTNEEMRSTLEELETSKEELESMNEELITLNQENRHKVEELRQISGDLQNLLVSTDIATLFLDRGFQILRFTPRIADLFNVRPPDRGRPLSDLTHRLRYPELVPDATRVLADLQTVEREVERDDGRWFLARLVPYRTTDDRIEGVVITFVDITARRQAELELLALNEELERRVARQTEDVRTLASNLSMAEHDVRRRLSQVLHDDLQQRLHALQMRAGLAGEHAEQGDVPRARELIGDVEAGLGQAIEVTRRLSTDLSPPILASEGLQQALGWLAGQMAEMHGLHVDVSGEPVPPLPSDVRVFLFQIVRELLFNVVKHAETDEAEVRLLGTPAGVVVVVRDRGRGFDVDVAAAVGATPGHLGLTGIRERLDLLGGVLEIESASGRGAEIRVRLPLDGEGTTT